jgi:hypothetical protein
LIFFFFFRTSNFYIKHTKAADPEKAKRELTEDEIKKLEKDKASTGKVLKGNNCFSYFKNIFFFEHL